MFRARQGIFGQISAGPEAGIDPHHARVPAGRGVAPPLRGRSPRMTAVAPVGLHRSGRVRSSSEPGHDGAFDAEGKRQQGFKLTIRIRDADGWRTELAVQSMGDGFFDFLSPGVEPTVLPYR